MKNDELLAAFERAEIRSYQFVAQVQTVTDEIYESGGSEESDDEVGDVDGSGITRGARSERTGNSLPYRPTDFSRKNSNKNLYTPTNKSLFYLKIIHSCLGISTAAFYPQKKRTMNKTTAETNIAGESHVATPETFIH